MKSISPPLPAKAGPASLKPAAARVARFLSSVGGLRRAAALALVMLAPACARAQWLTQSIPLNPGWNAVYLNVTATNDTLENLVGAASPISDIWLWQPNLAEGRIINNPLQPISGSDWLQWSKVTGPANAFELRANTTYLIRNSGGSAYSWNLKGKPVPPASSWASSGLNFIGFSTRADNPPLFANFLAPALSASPFNVFYYPGFEVSGASPNTAQIFSQGSTPVNRGQAYWIKKQDNSDNRYFGPFDVVLQDYRGVNFSDSLGAYSLRLKNQTTQTNKVTLTFLPSETTPSGDSIPTPPLLLRTAFDTATLKFGHTNLPVNQGRNFTLAPKGKPGSEIEVVIGLDRANMVGTNGAPFAGILRLQDSTLGHLQVDLPVSAFQASSEGLWVGNASITQVGNYLKTYAKATNAVDFTNQLATLNALNAGFQTVAIPAGLWTPHDVVATDSTRIASSSDGVRLVAAVKDGRIQTSADSGATWTARETVRNWRAVASSADGVKLVAAAFGDMLYTSADAGLTWTARESSRDWSSVASSADGTKLAATASGGQIYTSSDAGQTWSTNESVRAWTSVASAADGTNLVACAAGDQIFTSSDAGLTWAARESVRAWTSVASSADGTNLVASATGAQLYTSSDAGVTWVPQETSRNWTSVASSADGVNLVAGTDSGKIYTSTDSGSTWTERDNDRSWISIASSSSGANLMAVGVDSARAHLYKSTDAGTNWNRISPYTWSCLASSADGTNLVAAVSGGQIYTSSDAGQGWQLQPLSPSTNWQAIASSADGVKVAAAVKGGAIYTSTDSGVNWSPTSAPIANWQSIASSDDGLKLAAVVDGGGVYTSSDGGANWIQRPLANQAWQSVACSMDGKKLLAAVKGGNLYSSGNSGAAWTPLFGAPSSNWKSVASSSDGKMLVAAESPGGIYTSIDSGATWDLKASAPLAANWQAVASSKNGSALVAAINGGRIYTSPDAGKTWAVGEANRTWISLASSGDGSRLAAGEAGASGQLYTTVGTLTTPKLVYDTNSNLILSGGGKYLTATFDTELGNVPAPFPLRLIIHQGSNGVSKLLQHVFVGPDKVTSNSIITLDETKLHSGLLSQARRLSAIHLPLSNTGWVLNGDFGGVGIMNTVLTDGYDNQSSNPFVHSYHPDHDNLDPLFKPIGRAGVESYDIKRQITLSFTPPGDDFTSRTVGSSSVQGTYLENIVLKGSENQTRTVVTKGTFILNRVSSIPSIQ